MKISKRIVSLLVAAFVIMSLSVSVFAAPALQEYDAQKALVTNGKNIARVTEINFAGDLDSPDKAPGTNPAREPEKLVNGTFGGASRFAMFGQGVYFEATLDSVYDLSGVGIAFHDGNMRVSYAEVWVSEKGDGSDYKKIMDIESNGVAAPSTFEDFMFTAKAKKVKIIGKGNILNDWFNIQEIVFYGNPAKAAASAGTSTSNPKTGDVGTIPFILLGGASLVGGALTLRRKKK